MTDKKEKIRENEEILIPDVFVKIGDVTLGSNYTSIENLCQIIIWLLKQKSVKEYLEYSKKTKKLIGGIGFG